MDDHYSHRFSSGLELGHFIATSDLLEHSWKAIAKLRSEIKVPPICLPYYGYYNERSNCKILAFVTPPNCTENPLEDDGGEVLVSLSDLLKDEFSAFEFLHTKTCPDSAINAIALDLFRRFYPVYEQEISRVISNPNTQLIITGHALGGAVASLFTLLLLDSLDLTKTKRPLCITFGSPFLGNGAFQNAISQFSTWSSCFLHVVSNQDPLPRRFLNYKAYHPFGTFLFCSQSGGCSCFEDPKSILKLLDATKVNNDLLTASSFFDYKETIDRLIYQSNLKATMQMINENAESWIGSIVAQLEAIGVTQNQAQQQQQMAVDVNKLAKALKDNEMNMILENTKPFAKSLNDVKINMAKLEWYKKKCKFDNIGYYDSYKNERSEPDIRVAEFKKILQVYWENKVEEAERKPLRVGAPFDVKLLFGGTNYRRMVEPLDIAEHYRKGLNDYKFYRPKHYTKLEQWFKESATPDLSSTQSEAVSSILTVDSLFWEHVEEAVLACDVVQMVDCSEEEKEAKLAKLAEFEDYVVELMKNYAVSSEIFLPHSTFMRWWEKYDEIVGDDHDSVLSRLMRNEEYENYGNGNLEIH